VEAAVRGGHAKNAGAQGSAFGVEAECALDGANTVGKRQEIEHIAARKDDEPVGMSVQGRALPEAVTGRSVPACRLASARENSIGKAALLARSQPPRRMRAMPTAYRPRRGGASSRVRVCTRATAWP